MQSIPSNQIFQKLYSLFLFMLLSSCGGGDDAPAPDPIIASIQPLKIGWETDATGNTKASLSSTNLKVFGSKQTDGSRELALSATDSNLRLLISANGNTSVASDSASGIRIISERGPKGTIIRLYDAQEKFISGYFIEQQNSQKVIWTLKKDGTTDPSNLMSGKIFLSVGLTQAGFS